MNKAKIQAVFGNLATVEKICTVRFDGTPCKIIYSHFEPANVERIKQIIREQISPKIGYTCALMPARGIRLVHQ
jgi:hypothetical protein